MHYRNGREAKAGDRVLNLLSGKAGMIHSLNAGATSCNGRLTPVSDNYAYVTISECVHLDDINAVFPNAS